MLHLLLILDADFLLADHFYKWQDNNLLLKIHIQANGKTNEFIGIHNQSLKVKIKSPPIDGKANKTIIKFLATKFNLSKSSISIISGELNRAKRVLIKEVNKLPEWLIELDKNL